jgi:hypothetical protein
MKADEILASIQRSETKPKLLGTPVATWRLTSGLLTNPGGTSAGQRLIRGSKTYNFLMPSA